jgi:hypothetical protein
MTKLSLLIAFVLTFSTLAFADISEDVFTINKAEVEERFINLKEIEHVVVTENLDVSALEASHPSLISTPTFKLSKNFSIMSALATMDDPPLGIPSFLWGMCLGLPGLAVVYFITEDSDETKKALWGCIASIAVYTVLWLLYAIIVGVSFWGWYI